MLKQTFHIFAARRCRTLNESLARTLVDARRRGRPAAAILVIGSLFAAGSSAADPTTTLPRSLFGLPEAEQAVATEPASAADSARPTKKRIAVAPRKPSPRAPGVKQKKKWRPLAKLKKFLPKWRPRLALRKLKLRTTPDAAPNSPPNGGRPLPPSPIRQAKFQVRPRLNIAVPPQPPAHPAAPRPVSPVEKPAPTQAMPASAAGSDEPAKDDAANLETLIEQLHDDDAAVRSRAVAQICDLGVKATAVLPALEQLTYDKSADVRASAAAAVWNVGQRDMIAAKTLLPLLDDEDEDVAAKAVWLLGGMKQHARPALNALREKLAGSEGPLALELTEAIAKIDPADSKVIDRMVEWLGDADVELQSRAAAALAATDLQYAGRVVQPLVSRLGVKGEKVADAARQTLAGFLTSQQPGYAEVTAYLLGNAGEDAAPLLPELRQLLADRKGIERVQLAEAIVKIEPVDVAAVDVLVAALSDDEASVRCQAAYALASVSDQHFDRVRDPLKTALDDGDGQVRSAARRALAELEFGRAG